MADETLRIGGATVRYVHEAPESPYALIEWVAPPGEESPPVHVHRETDEGFYVLAGTYAFLVDGRRVEAHAGSHVLVPRGCRHTFWNAGAETAGCLCVITPPAFAAYFRELADALAADDSEDAAMRARRGLAARYDIEVVGPPVTRS